MNSDEGLPCVNTIEKVYLGLLVTVFALGIFSLFRLVYFKAELQKVFDPRQGFTNIHSLVFVTIIFDVKNSYLWIHQRLKWYGIEPMEENKAKNFKDIYGEDCQCEFDVSKDFKCNCGWNSNITLKEHNAFQDFRIVSKLGINGPPIMTFYRRHKSRVIHGSLRQPDSEYYTKWNRIEPKTDRNQVLNQKKHVNKNIKIQLHLHVKSNESFLKAPLLELYLARIENIPEFVIKFSTGWNYCCIDTWLVFLIFDKFFKIAN